MAEGELRSAPASIHRQGISLWRRVCARSHDRPCCNQFCPSSHSLPPTIEHAELSIRDLDQGTFYKLTLLCPRLDSPPAPVKVVMLQDVHIVCVDCFSVTPTNVYGAAPSTNSVGVRSTG